MSRIEVSVPGYGMTDSGGYVVRWLIEPGERVELGAPLVVIETAKAETEIEAPAAGVLRDHLVAADVEVPVGAVLCWIESDEI